MARMSLRSVEQFFGGLLCAAFLFGTNSVAALVIVDQLALPPGGGLIVTTCSDLDCPREIADDFTVTTARPVRVTQVEWVGDSSSYLIRQGGNIVDDFWINFYREQNDGTPRVSAFATVDVSGSVIESPTGNPNYSLFTASITKPVTLVGNERYYLSVVADTREDSGLPNWTWFFDSGAATYFRTTEPEWTPLLPRNYSYRLTGDAVGNAVPEPASLALLALGVAGLAMTRRGKQ